MTDASTSTVAARPRRRVLRWFAGVVGLLVLLLFASGAWLLGTSSGLRFALARAEAFTHGALTVQQAQGRLVGPLTLTNLRYRDGSGLDAQVATAQLDLRALLLMQLESVCCHPPSLPQAVTTSLVPWSTVEPVLEDLLQPLPQSLAQMLMVAAEQLCSE
ncbi:MAG: hypothetical protein WDW36_008972 [Sanguina aurantia]